MMRIARILWAALILIGGVACRSLEQLSPPEITPSPLVRILGQQKYDVELQLRLVNEGPGEPEKQNIWVALIQDHLPYQTVQSMNISPKDYVLVRDEYGNQYAEFDLSAHPPGTTKIIQINYRLTVNELVYDLSACEGELIEEFTQPELHIESANPQIVFLADKLSRGTQNTCQQVRAYYDYIGDELIYSFNGNHWGAQATLGFMGADCTEYAALLAALSRAKKIPARYYEGLLYLEGKEQTSTATEHAWVDIYLPNTGWVSMDPTLGRSSVFREKYFAHHTPEHIIIVLGANPSTLRGSSYWTHLYWPGSSATIRITSEKWEIKPVED